MDNVSIIEILLSFVIFALIVNLIVYHLQDYKWMREGNVFICTKSSLFNRSPISKVLLRVKRMREIKTMELVKIKDNILENKIKLDMIIGRMIHEGVYDVDTFKKQVKSEISFINSIEDKYKFEYRFESNRITIKAKNKFSNEIVWSVNFYHSDKLNKFINSGTTSEWGI